MRFSEDLDFYNCGIDEKDFDGLANLIRRELTLDGYEVVIKNGFKGAYHCHINTVPPALLLSQKIMACLKRKKERGRDFF